MAAVPQDDSWIELQRRREERMRFEVLEMLHRACGGAVGETRNAWSFALDLGIWHAELFRVVEWLTRHELVRYCGAGPRVALTERGRDLVVSVAGRRRSIRLDDV